MKTFGSASIVRRTAVVLAFGIAAVVMAGAADNKGEKKEPIGYSDTPIIPGQKWKVHDIDRPRPRIITPGAKPGDPPSDAVVLFDGRDLSKWEQHGKKEEKGKIVAPKWIVKEGYFEILPHSGDLVSKEKFGDAQYHIEWATPNPPHGSSQLRGNSGIILMERYEVQVLDSFNNLTYADGQAGAIYGQWPPLVNAARGPGQWQTYDIVFEAPKFDAAGKVVKRPFVTVFHNGVLVHHRQEIVAPMAHRIVAPMRPHAPEESLMLQDHDYPVRYRNIWVRKLRGYDQP